MKLIYFVYIEAFFFGGLIDYLGFPFYTLEFWTVLFSLAVILLGVCFHFYFEGVKDTIKEMKGK